MEASRTALMRPDEKMQTAVLSATASIISIWRICKMTKQVNDMTRGIGVGMAIGAIAGAAGSWLIASNKRQLRRKARHTGDMISDFMDNVGMMIGK